MCVFTPWGEMEMIPWKCFLINPSSEVQKKGINTT
jgi:hypothetical protein